MYKLVYQLFPPPRLRPSTSLRNLRNVRKQNRNLCETCAKLVRNLCETQNGVKSTIETSESKIARLKFTPAFEKKMGEIIFPKPRAVKPLHLRFASFEWRQDANLRFVLVSITFRFQFRKFRGMLGRLALKWAKKIEVAFRRPQCKLFFSNALFLICYSLGFRELAARGMDERLLHGSASESDTVKSKSPRLWMSFVRDTFLAVQSFNHVFQVAVRDDTCLGRIFFFKDTIS